MGGYNRRLSGAGSVTEVCNARRHVAHTPNLLHIPTPVVYSPHLLYMLAMSKASANRLVLKQVSTAIS